MKGIPAYLAALGVLVVAVAFVYTVLVDGRASGGSTLAKLQASVESLRSDIAGLRIAINEVKTSLGQGSTTLKQPDTAMTGGGPEIGGGSKPDVEPPVEDLGSPKADEVDGHPPTFVLEISAGGDYRLDGSPVSKDDLQASLKRLLESNPAMALVVKADESVAWADVTACVDAVNAAGIIRVSFGGDAAGQ